MSGGDGATVEIGGEALVARARALAQGRGGAGGLDDIAAAGLLRILQPARHGGLDRDLETHVRTVLEIGRGRGETAWVYGLCGLGQWLLGRFDARAQDDVWGAHPDAVAAVSLSNAGLTTAADGGARLSGRWPAVVGCDGARWLVLGVDAAGGGDGPGARRFALVPKSDVALAEDAVPGSVRGAGGKTVAAAEVFVPAHRLLLLDAEGVSAGGGPLDRLPLAAVARAGLCAPVVAMAAGALAGYVETTRARTTRGAAIGGGRPMAAFATIQARVAEAGALVEAARLLLLEGCRALDAAARDAAGPDAERRLRTGRDLAFAARLAAQAADRLFESAGGQSLFDDNPVQRAWRNIHAAAREASLDWDAAATEYGRSTLGLPPEGGAG